jgi:hypothetical protein
MQLDVIRGRPTIGCTERRDLMTTMPNMELAHT